MSAAAGEAATTTANNPAGDANSMLIAAAAATSSKKEKDAAAAAAAVDNARYSFDADALQQLRSQAPWVADAKYFHNVALSPSAVMKIMMHCQSGVEKGIAKGGNPIEVMGMLLGRPDPITPTTLVVTDAFPLPIEGFETRVVADDDNVVNHMIELGESLERTRKEKFMGWYHSHPFDLADHSHCFLSQTDLSTQLQWQRAEDPHGNPFVAIVVDPLRSMHQQEPELKAFRAYPPEYNSAVTNECPDGTVEAVEQVRLEQWGSCWNRYYELNVEYYMSSTSRRVLEQLTQDYLWIRNLNSQPPTTLAQKLTACSKQFHAVTNGGATTTAASTSTAAGGGGTATTSSSTTGGSSSSSAAAGGGGGAGGRGTGSTRGGRAAAGGGSSGHAAALASMIGGMTGGRGGGSGGGTSGGTKTQSDGFSQAVGALVDVTTEQLAESTLHNTKKRIFS